MVNRVPKKVNTVLRDESSLIDRTTRDRSRITSEMYRLGSKLGDVKQEIEYDEEDVRRIVNENNAGKYVNNQPEFYQDLSNVTSNIDSLKDRERKINSQYENAEGRRNLAAQRRLESNINNTYGTAAVGQRVREYGSEPNIILGANDRAQQSSYSEVQRTINGQQRGLSNITQKMIDMQGMIFDPNTGQADPAREREFRGLESTHKTLARSLAQNVATKNAQEALGLDPVSSVTRSRDLIDRANRDYNLNGGQNKGIKSEAEVMKALSAAMEELTKKTKELAKAQEEGTSVEKRIQAENEHRKAEKDIDQAVQDKDALDAQNASRDSRLRAFSNKFGTLANNTAEIAGAIGGIARTNIGWQQFKEVDMPFKRMELAGQAAGIMNTKYNDFNKAASGDAMSLLRVMGGNAQSDALASEMLPIGQQLAERKRAAGWSDMAVQGLTGAAKTVAYGIGGALVGGPVGAALGIGAGLAGTASDMYGTYTDMQKQKQMNEENMDARKLAMEAWQRKRDFFSNLNEVKATQMNAYIGQMKGVGEATTGLGSQRGAFFDSMMKKENRDALAEYGMDPNRAAETANILTQTAGTQWDAGTVKAAARVSYAGIMGSGQFAEMQGSLASAGGSKQEAENMIAAAMSRGIDSAKVMQQMANATIALSSRSTSEGVSSIAGVREIITSMLGAGQMKGTPENLQIAAVENQYRKYANSVTDTSVDLFTLNAYDKMRGNFGKDTKSILQQTMTRELDPGLVQQWIDDPNSEQTKSAMKLKGVTHLANEDGSANVKMLQRHKQDMASNAFNKTLVNSQTSPDTRQTLADLYKDNVSPEANDPRLKDKATRDAYNSILVASGQNLLVGQDMSKLTPAQREALFKKQEDLNKNNANISADQSMKTADAKNKNEMLSAGESIVKNFNSAKSAAENIKTIFNDIANNAEKVQRNADRGVKSGAAGIGGGGNLENTSKTLDNAATKLNTSSEALLKAANSLQGGKPPASAPT